MNHGRHGRLRHAADQSSYSDQYCRMPDHSALVDTATRARPRGHRDSLKMLVCRVLLGGAARPAGLRRPPAGGSGRLNDSVSNNPDTVDDCASQGSMYGADNAVCST